MSKSVGNILAAQLWLKYGPPQTLLLLMFKRSVGSRSVWVKDIPTYSGELDELEDVYVGRKQVKDLKELAKLRGLYEYCWNMKPPSTPSVHIPHNLLVYLVKVAPKDKESDFVREKLASYGYKVSAADPEFLARLERALNWARDIETISTRELSIEGKERDAVLELAGVINASNDEAYLQNAVFTIAKHHDLHTGNIFMT